MDSPEANRGFVGMSADRNSNIGSSRRQRNLHSRTPERVEEAMIRLKDAADNRNVRTILIEVVRRFAVLLADLASLVETHCRYLNVHRDNTQEVSGADSRVALVRKKRLNLFLSISQKFELPDLLLAESVQWRPGQRYDNFRTIRDFLDRGPDIPRLDQEDHPRWGSYSNAIKRFLRQPESDLVLQADLREALGYEEEEVGNQVGINSEQVELLPTNQIGEGEPSPVFQESLVADLELGGGGIEVVQEFVPIPTVQKRWRKGIDNFFRQVKNRLFVPTAILVWAINISAALGYPMLVYSPDSSPGGTPKTPYATDTTNDSLGIYIKIDLSAWASTIAILLLHGLFFGLYPTISYARRIILLSIVLCGTAAFSLRMLNANATSGVLIGLTLSVLLLEIW